MGPCPGGTAGKASGSFPRAATLLKLPGLADEVCHATTWVMKRALALLMISTSFWVTTSGRAATPGEGTANGFEGLLGFDDLPLLRDWPAYQDSSYSRANVNQDAGNFLRVEPDGEQVLVDTDGPGVVTRLWSTGVVGMQMSDQCRLRFWFDGEAQPRLDLSIAELFGDKGSRWPFVPPLAVTFESGVGAGEGPCNLSYVPIPFSKHLKITGRNIMFYHVNYHRLPAGTSVESFSWELAAKHRETLDKAAAQWQAIPRRPGATGGKISRQTDFVIPAGGRHAVELSVGGVIRELRLKLKEPSARILRSLVLQVSFEEAQDACVRVPVGDFFGAGAGEHRFESLPCGMTEDGYYSYWPMPFRTSAGIELINEGSEPAGVESWQIVHAVEAPPPDAGYFHARYAQNPDVPMREDYHILDVAGRGKLVGCNVTMQNARKAQGIFFLEGDEKIYVDGEAWPSRWVGTGTEDYFNGSYFWNHANKAGMARPLGGLTFLDWGIGRVCAYRWHFPDSVNFARRLQLDLEHGGESDWPVNYASVAYYYLETPSAQQALPPVASRWPRTPLPPAPTFLGCELTGTPSLSGQPLVRKTFPELEAEFESEEGLWFGRGGPGERVVVRLQVPGEDDYQPVVWVSGGTHFARLRVSLEGTPVGDVLATRPAFSPWIQTELSPVRLRDGIRKLELEILAAQGEPTGGGEAERAVGLVAVQLRPQSRFIDAWSVVGNWPCPKDTGWGKVWEPETNPDLDAVYTLPGGREARWKEAKGGTIGLGGGDWQVAYGLSHVWSPDERSVALFIGKDDGLKVWVNEVAVFEQNTWSHAVPDSFHTTMKLRKGWNRILVKCANWNGGWTFMLRPGDPDRELRFARQPE